LTPLKTYFFRIDPNSSPSDNPTGIQTTIDDPAALSRTFVPGHLAENLTLQESDPGYKYRIMAMGSKYEAALLKGDWDAFGGSFFEDFSTELGVMPFKIPAEWRLIAAIDPGWSSPCAFGVSAIDFEGNMYRLFTYYEHNRSAGQHAEAINSMLRNNPYTVGRLPDIIVSGRDAFARKDRYAIIANERTFADIFQEAGIFLEPAVTDRITGWWAWKNLMKAKRWHYFIGTNEALIEEILAAEQDERQPEDIKGRGNDPSVSDHALDQTRYEIMAAGMAAAEPEAVKPSKDIWLLPQLEAEKDARIFW